MAALLYHITPIPSSFPPLSRHRFLQHNIFPKTPIPSFPSLKSAAGNLDPPPPLPEADCPVPAEQQPINEYQSLSSSLPFSWASGDIVEYSSRLFVTGAAFAVFIGLPVSWFGSVGPESEPVKRILAAASSGIFVVTLAVVRMYLGWAYVGNRLLSATVEYEETGWYDGQVWVKTAEILARDRLLGSFSVKPVLSRLKNTLVILAVSLFTCVLLLINIDDSPKQSSRTFRGAQDRSSLPIPGAYNDNTARTFEPEAFCGEPSVTGNNKDDNPLYNRYADYEAIHPSEDFSSDFALNDGTQVVIEAVNELKGLKRPKAGFHCMGGKRYWTKSLPGDRFFASFSFFKVNPKAKWVHRCHFRSNLGYANLNIVVTPALGRSCPGYRCVLAIRREGLLMKDTKELTPWTPWPRRQPQPFHPGDVRRPNNV